jgi:hypothetical protein
MTYDVPAPVAATPGPSASLHVNLVRKAILAVFYEPAVGRPGIEVPHTLTALTYRPERVGQSLRWRIRIEAVLGAIIVDDQQIRFRATLDAKP